MKKLNTLLIPLLVCSLFACTKDENNNDNKEQTTIDGEVFAPNETTVVNTGKNLVLTFKDESQSIEITTNDTVAGTYEITTQSLKTATLLANLVYTDGTTNYSGNSGSVYVTYNTEGAISGTYSATVVSEDNIELEISSGAFSELDVEPEETDTIIPVTEASVNDTLELCYSNFSSFIEFSYLFDAVYSNQVSALGSTWDDIYNHTQNPTNGKVARIWIEAWKIILETNFIIENVEDVITDEESKNLLIAQAKSLRAYSFFTLLSWFGELPVYLNYQNEQAGRESESVVLAQIKSDVEDAIEYLPLTWSDSENYKVTKSFAKGLLCRVYMQQQQYSDFMELAQKIINSGNYSLSSSIDNFSRDNSEMYWGFEQTGDEEFNTFFAKGSYVPVIRYTETLLSYSESALHTGQQTSSLATINMLKSRRGEASIAEINVDVIYEQWKTEMQFEGNIFYTMKRFGKDLSELQIQEYQEQLPIPQSVLYSNTLMTQNMGY